ncbi:hypothetical protein CYMTET_23118 [Cymbomonas tetramitiformis]|uniref:Uncharacterized protein n=1 Tax=Cymbomonas tetramitiformis TaxID=36881 RepID=A0AAE0FYI5_9CHLO|nr:hypothetical protein CYMTET_23118 [Cymbomonas tetramitiformis]
MEFPLGRREGQSEFLEEEKARCNDSRRISAKAEIPHRLGIERNEKGFGNRHSSWNTWGCRDVAFPWPPWPRELQALASEVASMPHEGENSSPNMG